MKIFLKSVGFLVFRGLFMHSTYLDLTIKG